MAKKQIVEKIRIADRFGLGAFTITGTAAQEAAKEILSAWYRIDDAPVECYHPADYMTAALRIAEKHGCATISWEPW